jgi:hypothetical protein
VLVAAIRFLFISTVHVITLAVCYRSIAVERVAPLFGIREVLGSNIAQTSGNCA